MKDGFVAHRQERELASEMSTLADLDGQQLDQIAQSVPGSAANIPGHLPAGAVAGGHAIPPFAQPVELHLPAFHSVRAAAACSRDRRKRRSWECRHRGSCCD